MKRILVLLLAAMLSISVCAVSQAETAQYYTTQEFLDYLDQKDVYYTLEGIDNAGYEVVKVSNRKDIDTSNLSNGVYFVRTTINDETTVHKLVINK